MGKIAALRSLAITSICVWPILVEAVPHYIKSPYSQYSLLQSPSFSSFPTSTLVGGGFCIPGMTCLLSGQFSGLGSFSTINGSANFSAAMCGFGYSSVLCRQALLTPQSTSAKSSPTPQQPQPSNSEASASAPANSPQVSASAQTSSNLPSASSEGVQSFSFKMANGTKFNLKEMGHIQAELAINNKNMAEQEKSYSAEEIRAFTASGGLRELVNPEEEMHLLEQEYSTQVPIEASSGTKGFSLIDSSKKQSSGEVVSQIEKPILSVENLESLLLSDDPWVAQVARTTLPGMVNKIKESPEERTKLRDRLDALLAKQPKLSDHERKMANMMEIALAHAELDDPFAKELANLESMNIREVFKLDQVDTRAGIDRMIAELESETEFLPKQSLFERVSATHRKLLSQKRL